MAYRFPDSSYCGPKKSRVPFETGYGDAAREAFHQVSERFFPDAIDEVDLLSGAFQLLAQGDTELAADWMEDLAAYQDRAVQALDEAGFAPDQHWREQWAGVAMRYREAADKVRFTLDRGAEDWLKDDPERGITPRARRELVRLVKLVDATYVDCQVLDYCQDLDVVVEVPGPTLRGTFHLPTMLAHAVARLLEDNPELLLDQPAPAKQAKAPKKSAKPCRRTPAPLLPVWIRDPRGHIVAGGMPLFPEFLEAL